MATLLKGGHFYYNNIMKKMYVTYTPSHEVLFNNYFLPTYPRDYQLILQKAPQESITGDFMSDGFVSTERRRVEQIIDGIKKNWGEYIVHSDVDVQFFDLSCQQIEKELGNYDLIGADDIFGLCIGFMAIRANHKTLDLFSNLLQMYPIIVEKFSNMQVALNDIMLASKNNTVNYTKFSKMFFSIGMVNDAKVWDGEDFEVPQNILLHHANYTIGTENKIKLLQYVKSKRQV